MSNENIGIQKYNPQQELLHLEKEVQSPYVKDILRNLARLSYRVDYGLDDKSKAVSMITLEKHKINALTVGMMMAAQNISMKRAEKQLKRLT